jgi:hypothetical protein
MDELNLEEFKINISQMSNNKLCEIIVANRYLGIMREAAILSMEELARRRTVGDDFRYEDHIEKLMSTLPKFDLDLNKIMKLPRMI